MSIIASENEFFIILLNLISKYVRETSDSTFKSKGLEDVIRDAAMNSLNELTTFGLLKHDLRVPIPSLANLIEISLDDKAAPKINLWPLVALLYPMAKPVVKEVEIDNGDGGSLSEAINGGRFIDLK